MSEDNMGSRKYTNHRYLDALAQRVLVFDGAMGTSLESMQLDASQYGGVQFAGCNDHLNLTCPEAVEAVHRSFLEVGVDVIETNTFRSNRLTLSEFGLDGVVMEINRSAAAIAKKSADAFSSSHARFVAGSMGPTGRLPSMLKSDPLFLAFDDAVAVFRQQALGLIAGEVDLLLLETFQDILEVKAAILGIHEAFAESKVSLPIQAQVTLDTNGRMLLGTDITAVLAILQGMPIDVIGLNCSTGPEQMRIPISYLGQHAGLPVSCLPNAGMPVNRDGRAVYPLPADEFARSLADFVLHYQLSVVGGCCGTTPEHMRQLVESIKGLPAPARPVGLRAQLASAFQAVDLAQEPAPLIIGERLNTQGSRKFKQVILSGDLDAVLGIASLQGSSGAHALDVCTALTEKAAEPELMADVVHLLSLNVDAPLVIDSTDPAVMEIALKHAAGRCLLNSINLEAGEEKARKVLALAHRFNAAVIALTIDEGGMGRTADDKLRIARRIHDLAVQEAGLDPAALVFDPLTFTLASGSPETRDAGIHTLEAITRLKKEFPDSFTLLGVSNISYGLNESARTVLNSVFLYHAVHAGLDLAILNPAQVTPYAAIPEEGRVLSEALIFDRSPQALQDLIAFYLGQKMAGQGAVSHTLQDLPLPERLKMRILMREREGLEADLDACVRMDDQAASTQAAMKVINDILLPAMQEIGEQFGRGELILPFVLQSAEIMRSATQYLEKYLEKGTSATKGRIVLATVYGDVHDIGKNLVHTILSNNGYEVLDLGKQVPVERIITEALEKSADAIGLSALLVSTSQQMRLAVAELHRRAATLPVLIGGAAVNQGFADQVRMSEEGQAYPGGVFFCRDAFDAIRVLDGQAGKNNLNGNSTPHQISVVENTIPSPVKNPKLMPVPAARVPHPPFWGAREVLDIPVGSLFEQINTPALYRISWGAGKARGDKWEHFQLEFGQRLGEMRREAERSGWLSARAVYGYWLCRSDGNALVLYQPDGDVSSELLRFEFPRQPSGDRRCLSDYFMGQDAGHHDLVAIQLVTLGQAAAAYVQELHKAGHFMESYYAHGLAAQITEAAANFIFNQIRQELKRKRGQGKRYSWGYPALPDINQHQLVLRLLPAESALGIRLTSAGQFIPEYTTAAMVVHHPGAIYFSI